MKDLEASIIGTWVHSHEEDGPDMMVYRKAGYPFPPARGRTGMEFRAGGELVYHGIGRAEGSAASPGHWAVEAPNQLNIQAEAANVQPVTLEVVSVDDEVLKVKR